MPFDPIAYINEPRWMESRLGLDRIRELLDRLGRPQDRLKFVHVAGTNGKGSTCAYLASILQAAGLRTGLFTSPYLITFEERIRVDGVNIALDQLAEVALLVKEQAEAMTDHPTEFELMTAVALVHFARQGCDIVVLEVGLGGRLDSTNVIDAPEAAVIARIGLDHTKLLGTALAAIAGEKAGIVKPGSAVVSWPQDAAAMAVVDASHGLPWEPSTGTPPGLPCARSRTGALRTCAQSYWVRISRRTRRWLSRRPSRCASADGAYPTKRCARASQMPHGLGASRSCARGRANRPSS